KTAFLVLAHVRLFGGDPLDRALINEVRRDHLRLAPLGQDPDGEAGLGAGIEGMRQGGGGGNLKNPPAGGGLGRPWCALRSPPPAALGPAPKRRGGKAGDSKSTGSQPLAWRLMLPLSVSGRGQGGGVLLFAGVLLPFSLGVPLRDLPLPGATAAGIM